MDQVVYLYGCRNMPWKKDVWQLQYYCYIFLNYDTSNSFVNICYCLLSVCILD